MCCHSQRMNRERLRVSIRLSMMSNGIMNIRHILSHLIMQPPPFQVAVLSRRPDHGLELGGVLAEVMPHGGKMSGLAFRGVRRRKPLRTNAETSS